MFDHDFIPSIAVIILVPFTKLLVYQIDTIVQEYKMSLEKFHLCSRKHRVESKSTNIYNYPLFIQLMVAIVIITITIIIIINIKWLIPSLGQSSRCPKVVPEFRLPLLLVVILVWPHLRALKASTWEMANLLVENRLRSQSSASRSPLFYYDAGNFKICTCNGVYWVMAVRTIAWFLFIWSFQGKTFKWRHTIERFLK